MVKKWHAPPVNPAARGEGEQGVELENERKPRIAGAVAATPARLFDSEWDLF